MHAPQPLHQGTLAEFVGMPNRYDLFLSYAAINPAFPTGSARCGVHASACDNNRSSRLLCREIEGWNAGLAALPFLAGALK
jgi:hypothetical protein